MTKALFQSLRPSTRIAPTMAATGTPPVIARPSISPVYRGRVLKPTSGQITSSAPRACSSAVSSCSVRTEASGLACSSISPTLGCARPTETLSAERCTRSTRTRRTYPYVPLPSSATSEAAIAPTGAGLPKRQASMASKSAPFTTACSAERSRVPPISAICTSGSTGISATPV